MTVAKEIEPKKAELPISVTYRGISTPPEHSSLETTTES